MELPKRKPTRLKGYDYSQNGAYFITICTKERKKLLSEINVGEGLCALPKNKLTNIGKITDETIRYINEINTGVCIEKYVIIPNHIHMIISINDSGGRGNPPLQFFNSALKKTGKIRSF